MKKIILLVTCILFTVGCATVKENEEKKEEEIIGRFFEVKWTARDGDTMTVFKKIDEYGNVIIRGNAADTNESVYKEKEKELRRLINEHCKTNISVFPNPTSSSATININKKVAVSRSFKYKLIFDQKIIYEDNILINGYVENNIVIPAHLIQKEGTYIVAYEMWLTEDKIRCQNTVPFMVMKK